MKIDAFDIIMFGLLCWVMLSVVKCLNSTSSDVSYSSLEEEALYETPATYPLGWDEAQVGFVSEVSQEIKELNTDLNRLAKDSLLDESVVIRRGLTDAERVLLSSIPDSLSDHLEDVRLTLIQSPTGWYGITYDKRLRHDHVAHGFRGTNGDSTDIIMMIDPGLELTPERLRSKMLLTIQEIRVVISPMMEQLDSLETARATAKRNKAIQDSLQQVEAKRLLAQARMDKDSLEHYVALIGKDKKRAHTYVDSVLQVRGMADGAILDTLYLGKITQEESWHTRKRQAFFDGIGGPRWWRHKFNAVYGISMQVEDEDGVLEQHLLFFGKTKDVTHCVGIVDYGPVNRPYDKPKFVTFYDLDRQDWRQMKTFHEMLERHFDRIEELCDQISTHYQGERINDLEQMDMTNGWFRRWFN